MRAHARLCVCMCVGVFVPAHVCTLVPAHAHARLCVCMCVAAASVLRWARSSLACCSLARSAFCCSSFCCCNASFSSAVAANLTKKLANVLWNTPFGATGAAEAGAGVGAGAGAGPGRGAGGAEGTGGSSPLIAVQSPTKLIFAKPWKPRSLWINIYYIIPISRRRAKNVIYPGWVWKSTVW